MARDHYDTAAKKRCAERKMRPCLRCDRRFITTKEVRTCDACAKAQLRENRAGETEYRVAEDDGVAEIVQS